jgi:hypothetical protein
MNDLYMYMWSFWTLGLSPISFKISVIARDIGEARAMALTQNQQNLDFVDNADPSCIKFKDVLELGVQEQCLDLDIELDIELGIELDIELGIESDIELDIGLDIDSKKSSIKTLYELLNENIPRIIKVNAGLMVFSSYHI